MYITYDSDFGWQRKDKIHDDDFIVGAIRGSTPADETVTAQLLARCYTLHNSECILWGAGSYGGTQNRKPTPYFLPHRADMKYAMPARQLLVASHLNIYWAQMPKFRIVMLCHTLRCVNVHHMMPESFRPRAQRVVVDHTPIVTEELAESTQEELDAFAVEIRDRLESPETKRKNNIDDIMKLLGHADTIDKKG